MHTLPEYRLARIHGEKRGAVLALDLAAMMGSVAQGEGWLLVVWCRWRRIRMEGDGCARERYLMEKQGRLSF